MPTIFVTGFGPFPGMPDNPSEHLVRAIEQDRLRTPRGMSIETAVLPTSWNKVAEILPRMHARIRPDIALHFGVSEQAHGYRIERLARNRTKSQPDVDGDLPPRPYISRRGPSHLHSALPTQRILLKLRALGVRAELSDNAGSYLCNKAFYLSLDRGRQTAAPGHALFVHIPRPPFSEQETELMRCAEAIIRACGDELRSRPALNRRPVH